ncbi:DUF6338 family protein [Rhodovulum sulfidophilum]|uniref:DUF6338 family protein n=1 Tax=Rhodovulum sulfidophilum TaxID=35806 RepID=UPI0013897F5F|nr:DUF6338 family protein [Rhodovulum sulfidophilum]NDK36045.1 hypothetical protein [Rhodovulum sulfidophilum]
MNFGSLLSPETFEFFARYLLAGYVVIFVRSAFVMGLRPKPAELLIEAIILSLIVQFIVYVLAAVYGSVVVANASGHDLPEWITAPPDILKLVAIVIVVPTGLGWTLGRFLKSDWRNGLLRRLSLPVIHPVQRAHDFAFGDNRAPGLVEVTFNDGTKIGGWFGEKSLAASDDGRSDLYLERAYIIDTSGTWREPSHSRAILINLRDVRSIEFLMEAKAEDGPEGENDR